MAEVVELGSVSNIVDCEHKTIPAAQPGEEYAYSIGTRDIKGGRILFGSAKRVSRDAYSEWTKRAKPKSGDLILAREAPVGEVGLLDGKLATCLAQRTVLIQLDEAKVVPRFIHYQLLAPSAQRWIAEHCEGSTVVHLNVADVRRIPIELRPIPEQLSIAEVLGGLDELVDANLRLANNLNDLARALGSRLLSELEPDQIGTLADVASVTRGYSYKSSELVEGGGWLVGLKNVGRHGVFRSDGFKPLTAAVKPHHLVENGDLLVAHTDLTQAREVIGRPIRVRRGNRIGPLVASLDLAVVRPFQGVSTDFLQSVLQSDEFLEHALGYCNGTTVLHMSSLALPSFGVPILSQTQMARFEMLAPLRQAADEAFGVADSLERTRDELLPLLMSGAIRVRAA